MRRLIMSTEYEFSAASVESAYIYGTNFTGANMDGLRMNGAYVAPNITHRDLFDQAYDGEKDRNGLFTLATAGRGGPSPRT
jgi:hypothetical protein